MLAVATALNLYGRRGSLQHAKSVFDQMPEPNVVSWTTMMGDTAMIAAYAQKGQLEEGKSLFDGMRHRLVEFHDHSVCPERAYPGSTDSVRRFEGAESDLMQLHDHRVYPELHSDEALKSFKAMQLEGCRPNKITFLSILDACSSVGSLADGKLIDGLVSESGHTEVVVRNVLINMYAKCGSLEDARNIFDKMLNPDVVSSTAMIAAYAKLGSIRDARRIFDKMREQDVVAWTAIDAAYAQNGHIDEAVSMFERMPVRDVVSWNTMIVAYVYNKRLEDAKRLFARMPRPNEVLWNTQNGECKLAFQLFPLMDLHQDKVTFLSVLDACGSIAGPAEGQLVHATIVNSGIAADLELRTTLVNTCGRCGMNSHRLWNSMIFHKKEFVSSSLSNLPLDVC